MLSTAACLHGRARESVENAHVWFFGICMVFGRDGAVDRPGRGDGIGPGRRAYYGKIDYDFDWAIREFVSALSHILRSKFATD